MEHDAAMAQLRVPPTCREHAGVGAHRSNVYFLLFVWSSFLELVLSVLSREPGSFDIRFERAGKRRIVFPLVTTPSER